MPASSRRRNPFLLAPMLTAFVLVISAVVGFFSLDAMTGIWPYITAGILTLMAFGCPLAVFFICRGIGTVSRLGLRRAGGRELGLAAAATAVLILQNAILKLGIFRGAYDGVTYELFGSPFSGNVTSVWELLAALVTLVLLPATAEELFFRGAVVYEYRFSGVLGQMLMSSLLFAFMALDFSRFFVSLLEGLLLFTVSFLTGSLFFSIAVHATCNLFALFAEKYLWMMSASTGGRTAFWFLLVSFYLLSLILFFILAEKSLRRCALSADTPDPQVPPEKRPVVIYDILSAPPLMGDILVFVVFAVIALFL